MTPSGTLNERYRSRFIILKTYFDSVDLGNKGKEKRMVFILIEVIFYNFIIISCSMMIYL